MSNKLTIGEILLNCSDEELLRELNENYPGMETFIINALKNEINILTKNKKELLMPYKNFRNF